MRAANGGYPEPPASQEVRHLRARHDACGRVVRVRVPHVVPARAVRRVLCDRCDAAFEAISVEEAAPPRLPLAAGRALRRLGASARAALRDPESRAWRYGGLALASAAVLAALLAVRSLGEAPPPASTAAGAPGAAAPAAPSQARVLRGPGFTLVLPAGWRMTAPPRGADVAARSPDGAGELALWADRAPGLSFRSFERRSLARLQGLAGGAPVTARAAGTAPGAEVTLTAARPGQTRYEVTLRAAGPYRYYLATTLAPRASAADREAARLAHNSLVPLAPGGGS